MQMETFILLVSAVKEVLMCVIPCIAICYAMKEHNETQRKKIEAHKDIVRNNLAKDVYALYCVEKEAVEQIARLTNNNEQTVKINLRKSSQSRQDNEYNLYPSRNVSKASSYITENYENN